MRIDNGSFAFNCPGCPSWGTAIVNQDKELVHLIKTDIATNIIIGMLHMQVDFRTHDFSVPIGKGSHVYYGDEGFDGATSEPILVSKFDKVYVNDVRVNHPFILSIIKDRTVDHAGRLQLKWTPKMTYGEICNEGFIAAACISLGITAETPWAVYDIDIVDQEKLVFSAIIGDSWESVEAELKKLSPSYTTPFVEKKRLLDKLLHQQIHYGAPGTGKSHDVNKVTSLQPKENVFRTTFHPDSDYSTFVGCYKPTKKNSMTKQILDWKDLVEKLKEYRNKYAETDAQVMFGCEYYQSLRGCENLGQLLEDAGGKNYDTYIKAGMKVAEDLNPQSGNSQITYEFVPQVFVKAYVRAHQTDEPVFLVIEEINRGNCAQIFGDIFQLLDRDENGVSNYAVKPDSDLEQYLIEHVEGYKPEEGMRLPPNLYILATMNTSDQSLFPIDSAFKRRWEWKYVKIKQGYKKDEQGNLALDSEGKKIPLGWKIEIKDEDQQIKLTQDWWAFIQKVNSIIASMTSSADKQLGYFFCKADKDGVISIETFVSKVIFYLWNDVFKDYGFEDASLFRYKVKEGENEVEKDLAFPDFYDEDGENVNAERLVDFIQKVMDWQKPDENV